MADFSESNAGSVRSFAMASDGSLSDRKPFGHLYQLGEDPGVFPDGIKVGPNGDVFIGLNSVDAAIVTPPFWRGIFDAKPAVLSRLLHSHPC